MEVDFFSNVVSEEDTVEIYPAIDNFGFEGERCGICMDIIVDRGVLDCCQHWFCFTCIDNWASIINLCPLCQNQFQLITCVPVYDTIDDNNMDEDSYCRNNDWGAEGKNNILSFPSYYIDENAVTCLDRDVCKIRNGSVTYEESLNLDTSVACDSCDLWYHAFCVGFDLKDKNVDSWLCPRCLVNEGRRKSDSQGTYSSVEHLNPKSLHRYCLSKASAEKASESVANTGRTAVENSRMNGQHVAKRPNGNSLSAQDITMHLETDQSMLASNSCSPESKELLQQHISTSLPETSVLSVKTDKSIGKIISR